MAEQTFEFSIAPHRATVGPATFLFCGEVDVREMIEVQRRLIDAYGDPEADIDPTDTDRRARVVEGLRAFLTDLLVTESVQVFADAVIPERTLVQLYQWIQEVYGGRPTTPSSGSPDSQSESGTASTEPSPLTALPTPSDGDGAGSSTPSKSSPSAGPRTTRRASASSRS